jgi:hypothetical protein
MGIVPRELWKLPPDIIKAATGGLELLGSANHGANI